MRSVVVSAFRSQGRWPSALALSAAGLAVVFGLVAVPSGISGAQVVPAAARTPAAPACADVLFVGARGSGELGPGDREWKPSSGDPYGLGGTVDSAYKRLVADLGSHRTVKVLSVSYAANGVQTLVHAPNQYFSNLAIGVTWTLGVLGGQARNCPAQQIVLAGFSQGAMVMHRVLHDLGTTEAGRAILARVAAAILAGDGDELPHDYQTRYGTASTDARGIGQSLRNISHASAAKFSPSLTARVLSVCNTHDIVCGWTDFNLGCLTDPGTCVMSVAAMVKVHLSYPGSEPLLAAADRAATLVRQMPAPRPVSATAYLGTPTRYQFRADIASGYTLQWQAAPGAKLPPGLALSVTGLLAGTPATVGTYTTTVEVRAVRAKLTGPWLPATVKITVTVMPAGNWKAAQASLLVGTSHVGPVSISCPTTSFCVAVGNYNDPDGEGLMAAVATWSGGLWTVAPAQLPGNAFVPSAGTGDDGMEAYLNAVSCPNASYCVAVGQYTTDYADGDGSYVKAAFLLTFSGGTWTAAEAPGTGTTPQVGNLLSVSCPSASFCAAVGYENTDVTLMSANGSWRVASTGSVDEEFTWVSCGSPSFCAAADYSGVATWSNGVWKQATMPSPSIDYQSGPINGLFVTCPAAGQCVAQAEYEGAGGYHWPLYRLSAGSWTVDSPDAGGFLANGPACASIQVCVFPMQQTISGGVPNPDVLFADAGGTWSTVWVVPPAGAVSGDSGEVSAVACPSAAECIAIGSYTTDASQPDGQSMFVTFTP